ncbi:MAG: DUF3427 domain-containing protein, partial [Limisphaerales bacterium]
SWSEWKARARLTGHVDDQDLDALRSGLIRVAQTDGPRELQRLVEVLAAFKQGDSDEALRIAGPSAMRIHYRLWGKPGSKNKFGTIEDSFKRLSSNVTVVNDALEIAKWAEDESRVGAEIPELPFPCGLELHARYSSNDIKAEFGLADLESAGITGVGRFELPDRKAYILLVTFQKTEHEFSPTTMYADYPISRELLHWESQSTTTVASKVGQNLIRHVERNFTILIFARDVKKRDGITVPFTYLGPATLVSNECERPIKIVWKLKYPMPAQMFEENRRGA